MSSRSSSELGVVMAVALAVVVPASVVDAADNDTLSSILYVVV